MFGYSYYNATIRRYIILFGTTFNQIYITRTDDTGAVSSQFRVPIAYGPKDKALARLNSDPELNRPWSAILPFMTFQLVSFFYDGDRHLKKVGRLHGERSIGNKNVVQNVYNPVPYTFNFELNIMVKNAEDGTKIIEQIAPFFTPDWTTTIRVIDNPEILLDVPLILNPISADDTWGGSLEATRYITYTLSFKMLGYLYGPVRKDKIIKVSKTRVGTSEENIDRTTVVTPGLTVDGLPTTDPNETVPWSEIDWSQDYDFIESIE